jgi:hypothetical protein
VPSRNALARSTIVSVIATTLLAVVVCVVAATSTQPSASATQAFSHLQVTKMQVGSLPESPVLDWSPARARWDAALASVPAKLPSVGPTRTCDSGPVLTLYFADGSETTYQCGLPTSIRRLRDRLIALAEGKA